MIFERPNWMRDAACRGMDPELFMPQRGGQKDVQQAVKVCATCPVRLECLEYGRFERCGIWGGLSGKQRRRLYSRAS
jgi:WhiB family redox-sensing transcriptional regulator